MNIKQQMKENLNNFILEVAKTERFVLLRHTHSASYTYATFYDKQNNVEVYVQVATYVFDGYQFNVNYKPSQKHGSGAQLLNVQELSLESLEIACERAVTRFKHDNFLQNTMFCQAIEKVLNTDSFREINIIENMDSVDLKDHDDTRNGKTIRYSDALANIYDKEGNGFQVVVNPFPGQANGNITL